MSLYSCFFETFFLLLKGAESLRPLMDKACDYIPKKQWVSTPIALKATAGLRMLPNVTAQRLLDEVSVYSY
jgi:ectonucleoside triphosphate diphosphohydrolase 5/6